MMNKNNIIYLPDTMANWAWPRQVNKHYEEVKAETNAWFHSFEAVPARARLAFDKCEFALLASLAYPHASKEHLRTGSDLMMILFAADEYTDLQPEPAVRNIIDIMNDALRNPHKPRPQGEHVLGEITRQFWELAIKSASPTSQRHMVDALTAHLDSFVQQAEDRDSNTIRSISSYLEFRHENMATRPSFVPLELDLDLPDHVFFHPVIVELSLYVTDMIVIGNDLASYNKEQATGEDLHNILTLAMLELNVDLAGALDWALKHHRQLESKFIDGLKRVPSWGPEIDRQVQKYLNGVANWARANDCWSFESGRYFGNKGKEIQKTRLVQLLPKSTSSAEDLSFRRDNIVVPLIEALEAK